MAIDTKTTASVTYRGKTADLAEGGAELLREAVVDALTDQGAVLEHLPYPIPEAEKFEGSRGFLPADDLEQIADRVMAKYPNRFGHIDRTRITWLWKGKANRRGWTKPAKDLLGHFAPEIDFIIWLGANVLREEQFTHQHVANQVYHELTHIQLDGKGRLGVNPEHEWEGSTAELEDLGPWTAEFARLKWAMDRVPAPSMGPLFEYEDDEETGI